MALWNDFVRPILPQLKSLTFLCWAPVSESLLRRTQMPSVWADLQTAQHLAELLFLEVGTFFEVPGHLQVSDIKTRQKIIPHFPSLRTLTNIGSSIPILHAPQLANLSMTRPKFDNQEFGEQLSRVPKVKHIVLRTIDNGSRWSLPHNIGESGLDDLESLEITNCSHGPYLRHLLTSGRLTSLTIDFPWTE
jgi:hypothetical protein